jgi:hypothetical protein
MYIIAEGLLRFYISITQAFLAVTFFCPSGGTTISVVFVI